MHPKQDAGVPLGCNKFDTLVGELMAVTMAKLVWLAHMHPKKHAGVLFGMLFCSDKFVQHSRRQTDGRDHGHDAGVPLGSDKFDTLVGELMAVTMAKSRGTSSVCSLAPTSLTLSELMAVTMANMLGSSSVCPLAPTSPFDSLVGELMAVTMANELMAVTMAKTLVTSSKRSLAPTSPFDSLVGELMAVTMAKTLVTSSKRSLASTSSFDSLVRQLMAFTMAKHGDKQPPKTELRKVQEERVFRLAGNLAAWLDAYDEKAPDAFIAARKEQASLLASEPFGEILLAIIGEIYVRQAGIHHRNFLKVSSK
eukprot:gene10985-17756_t